MPVDKTRLSNIYVLFPLVVLFWRVCSTLLLSTLWSNNACEHNRNSQIKERNIYYVPSDCSNCRLDVLGKIYMNLGTTNVVIFLPEVGELVFSSQKLMYHSFTMWGWVDSAFLRSCNNSLKSYIKFFICLSWNSLKSLTGLNRLILSSFAVVWNPWDKKAKAMADFGDDEYKHMLCVEAAAIEKPITLKPGEEWRGRQELSAVGSSYCSGQLDPRKVLMGGWSFYCCH